MTTEEKAALITECKLRISELEGLQARSAGISQRAKLQLDLQRVAIAALTSEPASAPEGWRLVPVEPTQNMVDAHMNGVVSGGFQCGYRAMIAAAPTP